MNEQSPRASWEGKGDESILSCHTEKPCSSYDLTNMLPTQMLVILPLTSQLIFFAINKPTTEKPCTMYPLLIWL